MKTILNTLGICLLTLLLAARPSTALASPPHTGLHGQAFHITSFGWGTAFQLESGEWVWIGIGSIQMPVATSFSVLSAHNGREVARVETDASGVYSVSLPPGKYLLVPDVLVVNAFLNCTVSTDPIEFQVKAREFTFQNIFYFSQGWCGVTLTGATGGIISEDGRTAAGRSFPTAP